MDGQTDLELLRENILRVRSATHSFMDMGYESPTTQHLCMCRLMFGAAFPSYRSCPNVVCDITCLDVAL